MDLDSLGHAEELKLDTEVANAICRSCLSTDSLMYDVYPYADEIAAITGINISPMDGLPGWVCGLCRALLHRAARFRRQWRRAHHLLDWYLERCAPFPMDAQDPELRRYAAPPLRQATTLAFDNGRGRAGFTRPLQHETECPPSPPPEECPLTPLAPYKDEVKSEGGCSDYEDDIPLDEYKSSIDKLTSEALEQLLRDSEPLPAEAGERAGQPAGEAAGKGAGEAAGKGAGEAAGKRGRKSKKDKEDGGRSKKKKKREEEEEPAASAEPTPGQRSLRRAAEDVDPAKIRVITLNPEEQLKQMEEESKADGARLPFRCALCFKGFNYQNKLDNHMRRHSPSRGPHACALCRTYLPTAYSYRVHMRVHTIRYECVKCGRRMVDRGSIVEHYRAQHEGIVTQYTCHLCGKLSSNSKTHRGHMRNHHSGARPACHHCHKTFVNKDSLTEHLLIHDGVKNYKCEKCEQRFRTKNQAKHHQLKHSEARDHYCVECDVRFKSAHNLRQHLMKSLKHKDPNTFKFECAECGKRFESACARDRHLRVQHRGERTHGCGACGALLASRASLRKHARAHTAPRAPPQHVCHECGRAFRGKSVLLNHVRTHTGEKPFSCATCGRRFAQRTACRTHVRLVHLKLRRAKIKPESVSVAAADDVKPTVEIKLQEPTDDKMAADLATYTDIPVYF